MEISEQKERLDLWLAPEDAVPPDEVDRLREVVTPAEQRRADRYRRPADTRRSILGRGIARLAVARRAGVDVADVTIDTDDRGRPYVTSGAPEVIFNISHTTGLVAVVVGEVAVGVDVEWTRRKTDGELVARRWFHPDEVGELEELSGGERVRRFFWLWTLKEAYLKALGKGLAVPLRDVRFHAVRSHTGRVMAESPRLDERGSRVEGWTFSPFEPLPEHQGAIAVQATDVEVRTHWWPDERF